MSTTPHHVPTHHAPPLLPLTPHDCLLVIDMQRDFCPSIEGIGGALAVSGGDEIVPGINALAQRFAHVILTQDWHPAGHISFASTHGLQPYSDTVQAPYGTQLLWPNHCLQGSPGAELHPALQIPHAELILRKGFRQGIDSYSAFMENDQQTPTGLASYLRERGLTRLFFCGLAYDFCAGYSAIAAVRLGFQAYIVEDLSRAVGLPATASAPGTVEATNQLFADLSVHRIQSQELCA